MNAHRLLLFAVVLLLLAPLLTAANPPLNCVITATDPLLRAEGVAEQVGDIQFVCSGGDPGQVYFVNFILVLNTTITSDPAAGDPGRTEALLLIDDPLPGVENVSNGVTYQGQVEGTPGVAPGPAGGPGAQGSGNIYLGSRTPGRPNQLEWNGIPFVPPEANIGRVIRFTNVRGDMTRFAVTPGQPQAVTASLGASPLSGFLVGNPWVTVGYAMPAMMASVRDESGRFEMSFKETYPFAFRKRIENTVAGALTVKSQAPPNAGFFTESGVTPEPFGLDIGAPGVADTGTRLVAQFNGLPAGVFLTAPNSVLSLDAARGAPSGLKARRVLDFNPDFSGGVLQPAGGRDELVPVVDGQATLLYEVVAGAPFEAVNAAEILDHIRIPARLVFAQPTNIGRPAVSLGLAPISSNAEVSGPDPEPRFYQPNNAGQLFVAGGGCTLDYLTFEYTPSDPVPLLRNLEFEEGSLAASGTITVSTASGGDWLTATAATAVLTETVEVAVSPVGLAPGEYNGFIALRQEDAPDELRLIPVILYVKPPPLMSLDTTPVFFQVRVGDPAPDTAIRYIKSYNKWIDWEASTSTSSGGDWLSVTPAAARTPYNLIIGADPTGLPPGVYEGGVSVRSPTAVNSPQLIPAKLEILPAAPYFEPNGVVNAASYQGGAIAPGEFVTIFGLGVGPSVPAGLQLDQGARVSTFVAGTRILFDGVPAPIIALSENQSTCVAPFSVGLMRSVMVEVEVAGQRSAAVQVQATQAAPGIFTVDMSGAGQAAVVNQDGTINSPANPAPRGSVVAIYLTGGGETVPPGADGAINDPLNPPRLQLPASATIGGIDAPLEFVGGAPGGVAGFVQMNARVGAGVAPGPNVPLAVSFGQFRSQPGVTIAVQ